MNAPRLMKPTMSGGDKPPSVKSCSECELEGGDDELLVDAVAVVVGMFDMVRAYWREAVRIVRCA